MSMLQRKSTHQATLTKADIVELIYEYFIAQVDQYELEGQVTKGQASDLVEKLIEIIKHTLETGEEVMISGFGKFSVKEKHERRGRNPSTGKEMILKARRVVAFSASQKLKDLVNGKMDS